MSFGSFNKGNERVDSGKDSFILMNEFEQESHERASQNKARRHLAAWSAYYIEFHTLLRHHMHEDFPPKTLV